MNATKRGNELNAEDRAFVLSAYIYRQTTENAKAHPDAVRQAGGRLPLIPDARWLEISEFEVTRDGWLSRHAHACYTHHNEVPEWAAIIRAHNTA